MFFNREFNEADIKIIEIQLQQWSEFSEVYFVSPERAMQEFEGVGAEKEEMMAILDGENPIPPTVMFKPKADFSNKKTMLVRD